MGLYPVSAAKEEKLKSDMLRLGVREEDLIEQFVRGSGAGGQKINKTSIAVLLQHVPTGLEVRCQSSRSQSLNRYLARRILIDKIEEKKQGAISQRQQEREKIRRQKRKRSKRAQLKRLGDKKHHADKKLSRSGKNWD